MKIILLLLTMISCWGEDIVSELSPKVGDDFAITCTDGKNLLICSKSEFPGIFIGVNANFDEAPSPQKMIISGRLVELRPDESPADVAIINARIQKEIDLLSVKIREIPYESGKGNFWENTFFPRNKDDKEILGVYRALCSGIRPVPNAKFQEKYYRFEKVKIKFTDDANNKKLDSLLGTLQNFKS